MWQPKLAIVVLTAFAATAAGAGEDLVPAEMKQAQGEWRAVKWTTNEETETFGKKGPVYTVVDDQIRWSVTLEYESKVAATFSLDPTKSPKEIDWVFPSRQQPAYILKGIYSLQGDAVTICLGPDRGPRPRDFATKGKGGQIIVLERVDPAPKVRP